jgi:hypothetical protein
MCAFGQSPGAIKGVVADSSGALIPGAQVTVSRDANVVKVVTAGDDGSYIVNGLPAGTYTVQAVSPGMTQGQPATIEVNGAVMTLNLTLRLVLERQEITVQETAGPQISVDPAQSAATVVMADSDLDALSDDPDDLQADLIALAGPSAGPNGGQIYIDGFTAGDSALPNKDAIREIRVNQNPFSPEFDAIGLGRTEILTRPGRDRYRGQAYFDYGNAIFNSRNPYAPESAPFNLTDAGGSFGGPLNKSSSFFAEVDQRNIKNGVVINGATLDPATLAIIDPFTQVYSSPVARFRISPRIDYQLTKDHTLTFRYALTRTNNQNTGAGGFNLPTQVYNLTTVEHAFQASESWVINPKVLDETRFQFLHQHQDQNSTDHDPSIVVFNAFSGGGPLTPAYQYIHHHYEVQNNVSVLAGEHSWKFGVRLRAVSIVDTSTQNFDGTFIFGGAYAPILNANFQPIMPGLVCDEKVQSSGCQTISSIQQYQRAIEFQRMGLSIAQTQLLGGAPTQFSINTGNPVVDVGEVDVGLYVGDDWRLKPNLTLSLGLRYENQTNIHDNRDFAPRLGLAWAPGNGAKGGRPKTVIRAGFGIFYYRFSEQNTLIAERYNGVSQEQYVIDNPNFFSTIPAVSTLQQVGTPQAIHTVSSSLVAPYVIQSAIGIERQVPGNTTVSVNYTFSHGEHLLLSRNINAPLPGTYTGVAGSGVYPFPQSGPIYEMESGGLYNQGQLITNVNTRLNQRVSLFGFYVYGFVNANTDGVTTFPANQYNFSGEYGPAATDIRHRATIGGSITAWWGLRLSPLITAQTGAPFDITTSQDIYGTTVLTARPAFANDPSKPGLISTSYGLLDPNPSPGEALLPRNYGRGPGLFSADLRVARTWGLGERRGSTRKNADGSPAPAVATPQAGPAGRGGIGGFDGASSPGGDAGASGRRFSLTASVSIRNVLNHVNPGPIIGSINSPLFGQSNQIAGGFGAFSGNASNRRLEFQLRLGF